MVYVCFIHSGVNFTGSVWHNGTKRKTKTKRSMKVNRNGGRTSTSIEQIAHAKPQFVFFLFLSFMFIALFFSYFNFVLVDLSGFLESQTDLDIRNTNAYLSELYLFFLY